MIGEENRILLIKTKSPIEEVDQKLEMEVGWSKAFYFFL